MVANPKSIVQTSAAVTAGIVFPHTDEHGIFGIVSEFKGAFSQLEPRQIFQRDLQMLRVNAQQFDLLFQIQFVNSYADFHYIAHAQNLSPVEAKCKLRTRPRKSQSELFKLAFVHMVCANFAAFVVEPSFAAGTKQVSLWPAILSTLRFTLPALVGFVCFCLNHNSLQF